MRVSLRDGMRCCERQQGEGKGKGILPLCALLYGFLSREFAIPPSSGRFCKRLHAGTSSQGLLLLTLWSHNSRHLAPRGSTRSVKLNIASKHTKHSEEQPRASVSTQLASRCHSPYTSVVGSEEISSALTPPKDRHNALRFSDARGKRCKCHLEKTDTAEVPIAASPRCWPLNWVHPLQFNRHRLARS